VIDDRLSRSASTDQQTEVLPPADVPDGMPLPLAPKVIFLGGLFVFALLATWSWPIRKSFW